MDAAALHSETVHKPLDVVVAGHICLDVIPSFSPAHGCEGFADLFLPGQLIQVGPVLMAPGGAVANTGAALKILGMNTALMGKIGNDYFSKALLALPALSGLEQGMIRIPGEQTSYTIVLAPPGIDRIFLHNPGANDTYGPEDIPYEIVAYSKLFHFGYPPLMKRMYENNGVELAEIFRRVKSLPTAATSLDMALPDPASESGRADWGRILENTLPHVDFFLPSLDEALYMLDRERYLETAHRAEQSGVEIYDLLQSGEIPAVGERVLSMGAKVVILKCGAHGLYARTGSTEFLQNIPGMNNERLANWSRRELWHSTYHVDKVVSTTGSGDCTIAGFLSSWLRGCSLEDSLDMACAVGACNVTAMDALGGVRSWKETTDLLAAGWTANPWSFRESTSVWKELRPNVLWAGPHDCPERHGGVA